MAQMDKVTQSNAASAEESASAANELDSQAKAMNNAVDDLLSLVGGHQQADHTQHQDLPEAASTRHNQVPNSRNGPSRTNGHEQPRKAQNGKSGSPIQKPVLAARETAAAAIPMEGDFKNF
jgi:methyl-accepting chemotaxis protein